MENLIDNASQPFHLFLHIPKTGGTTLRYLVDEQFGPKNVIILKLIDQIEAINQNDLRIYEHTKSKLLKKFAEFDTQTP